MCLNFNFNFLGVMAFLIAATQVFFQTLDTYIPTHGRVPYIEYYVSRCFLEMHVQYHGSLFYPNRISIILDNK
jgi:hypothetical protein